ncbi:MAG: hypothetical protein WBN57_06225, partial [Gammaproteobacteria bacterium]
MAKILVEDRDEHTLVPFLRGILTHSLQDAGLPFDTAYVLATKIRHDLGDLQQITTNELRDRVLGLLKTGTDPDVISRYEKLKKPFAIEVEQRDGQLTQFSRLEYQHCLETIGVTAEEAMD